MPPSPADVGLEASRPTRAAPGAGSPPLRLAWLLLSAGLTGLAASFVLAVERYALLSDPEYVPSCSLNPIISCGSVMASPQAEAFGFPNPLLGVVGFSVVSATGAALLAGARLSAWFWAGLQLGVTAGVVFVHWLILSSLYRIGALCPYCMVVWAVTIPLFWYVTLRNLDARAAALPGPLRRIATVAATHHGVVLTAWFLAIAAAVLQRFWLYWSTLLG